MSVDLKEMSKLEDMELKQGNENHGFHNDVSDMERTRPAGDDADDDDDDEKSANACSNFVGAIQTGLAKVYRRHKKTISLAFLLLLLVAYIAYFAYAIYYRFGDEGSYRLLGATVFGAVVMVWSLGGDPVVTAFKNCYKRSYEYHGQYRCYMCMKSVRWFLYVAAAVFIGVYTGVAIGMNSPRNLMSLVGIAAFMLVMYITSIDPSKVNWHPVFWGMAIQFMFACLILRTSGGYLAFQWLGDRMTEILSYSNVGAMFVFGNSYADHMFAFKVLPVIIYFSALISVLYYLGVMQSIIRVLGRFLAFCLDTTATESLNAAGNIFAGQTESPLMIRPFLPKMTRSELHAVMTGGFATVSGSVLGAYVAYGVKANHLLAASVMSAPAALAISKLTYPETEKSRVDPKEVYQLKMESTRNVIEAASDGASVAISLVANVAVNLMAFLALLELINTSLTWFGDRVGVDGVSFQFICSYVFFPVSWVMGVDTADCRSVATLLGYKTFTNEFVAYIEMGKLINNTIQFDNYTSIYPNGSYTMNGTDIYLSEWGTSLIGGILSPRSQVITTYALCGFSNLGSMGIQIGGLGAMAPSRRSDFIALAMRAMVAGNVACFLTACIAGLFYTGEV